MSGTTDSMSPYQRTTHCVWEITLKCNLACSHCGSRAGNARANELSSAEALDLVHQLAEVGIKEVTLIGGEAFLRRDWLDIAREITKVGMRPTMTTGGYGINETVAWRMKEAGIRTVSVSVDGLEAVHDRLRGVPGSFRHCLNTIRLMKKVGIPVGSNTQINRLSAPEFALLYTVLRDAGITAWQVQFTVPMGNAADNHGILMQPCELLDVYPMLSYIERRGQEERVQMQAGNNIGYYGPYERQLRGRGDAHEYSFWKGCQAGIQTLGIEADGAIKGCPSLPTTAYTGGNIRQHRLADVIAGTPELNFNETQGTPQATEHMWGFCKSCEFAELCRGGCSWTAHVFFDRRGNNPYCHHRALSQAASGVRERVVQRQAASGRPFDNGVFDLYEESVAAPWSPDDPSHFTCEKIRWPQEWLAADPDLPAMIAAERDRAIEVYRARAR